MKILLLITLNICCVYIGILIYKNMNSKILFYKEFTKLLCFISKNIFIGKLDMPTIIKKFDTKDIHLKHFLDDYLNQNNTKSDNREVLLETKENLEVSGILDEISSSTSTEKIEEIIKKEVENLEKSNKEREKNFSVKGKSIVKLSFIIGLFITIMLL